MPGACAIDWGFTRRPGSDGRRDRRHRRAYPASAHSGRQESRKTGNRRAGQQEHRTQQHRPAGTAAGRTAGAQDDRSTEHQECRERGTGEAGAQELGKPSDVRHQPQHGRPRCNSSARALRHDVSMLWFAASRVVSPCVLSPLVLFSPGPVLCNRPCRPGARRAISRVHRAQTWRLRAHCHARPCARPSRSISACTDAGCEPVPRLHGRPARAANP